MHYTHIQRKEKVERGFTLVETLVAIVILLLVIIGPMTIAARGMKTGFYANEQTTAVYLAQEGAEWVQKLRDDNALTEYQDYLANGSNGNGNTWSWYTTLSSDCKDTDGCDVNYENGTVKDCTTLSNCKLKMDTGALASLNDRVYGYGTGWSESIYTRVIKVGAQSGGGVPVTVTVSWNSGLLGDKSVILQTWVYDQYQRFE